MLKQHYQTYKFLSFDHA